MSNRRRLLLSYLANSFKFLPYSYEYLYYGLVPTTIGGKTVKNKTKVSKLYGNSVVENQLLQPTKPTETQNGITITNNGDGSFTLTGTATATVYFVFLYGTWTDHYYLFKGINYPNNNVRWYDVYYGIYSSNKDFIFRNTNSSYTQLRASIRIESGTDFTNSPFTFFPNLIDLTQSYPFNTPTTLTDNRVQEILNRGYIPYNLGEIKDTDIGEIMSVGYNLFDEEWESGSIVQVNGTEYPSNNAIRSDYIKVICGQSYTFEWNTALSPSEAYWFYYDIDKNYIGYRYFGNTGTATIPQNCSYIRLEFIKTSWGTNIPTNLQTCFHRTGTRTGYAPYKAPQTIPFKYHGGGINTSHNTLEITNTAYVFTRNNAYVDLSKLTFSKYTSGSNWLFYANVSGGRSGLGGSVASNMLCDTYMTNPLTQGGTATAQGDDKTATWDANNSQILIKDTSYANVSDFQSNVSGTLEYQLATPQVITIPRKHLGIVDLGSLNWTKTGNHFYSSDLAILIKMPSDNYQVSNLYCLNYISGQFNLVYNETLNNDIGVQATPSGSAGYIHINDSSKSSLSATDFKNAMSGILLFYETENEVADITDTFDIQSGGTINTNSNVLPNADFLMKCK